jgi:hypothetical protein
MNVNCLQDAFRGDREGFTMTPLGWPPGSLGLSWFSGLCLLNIGGLHVSYKMIISCRAYS